MDARIGSELAGYRIESVIGRGGMGVVYLADHLRLSRKAALKILPPELADDERFRDRFIHESKLAASLDHPNIIDIYDAGEAEGLLYLAMRYVGGSDLKTLIAREGPLEPGRMVALLTQIGSALDAAHERGLVHRDIKPANVLVEPPAGSLGEHAYLTDFGLTKRPESMSGLTKTGQFLGSVEYAAPEQFEGRPIDARTDIYSLGCVAYECVTGEAPFPRESEAAVMYAHLKETPPKVTAKRADLPAGLDVVVARAMAKQPEDRHQSAGALAGELGAASRGERIEVAGGGPRRKRILLASGVAALVAIAVAVVLLVSRGGDKPGTGASSPPGVGGPAAGLVGVLRLDTDGHTVARIPQSFAVSDVPYDKVITTDSGTVWLGDLQSGKLYKINALTNTIVGDPITVTGATNTVVGAGSLWAPPSFFLAGGTDILRIDPANNTVSARIDTPGNCCQVGVAYGSGALWVLSQSTLLRIDPVRNRIANTIDVTGQSLAVAEGTVWVMDPVIGQLWPVDAKTNEVGDPIGLEEQPVAVAAGGGAVWVAEKGGKVVRIPTKRGAGLETAQLEDGLNDIFYDPSGVWVTNPMTGDVWRLDPDTAKPGPPIHVGGIPSRITVGGGGVWVVVEPPSPIWQRVT
jgi:hypothetical protein